MARAAFATCGPHVAGGSRNVAQGLSRRLLPASAPADEFAPASGCGGAALRHDSRTLARLARMDAGELTGVSRSRPTLSIARRFRCCAALDARTSPEARAVSRTVQVPRLSAQRWDGAHRALSRHLGEVPRRFLSARTEARTDRPGRAHVSRRRPHAALRADRILVGKYDLLGYRGLRFDRSPGLPPATGHSIRSTTDALRAPSGRPSPISMPRAAITRSSGSSIAISTGSCWAARSG